MTEQPTKTYRKNIHLTFPPDLSGKPIVSDLVRRYDLTVNILKAQITPRKEGHLTLELSGGEENCLKGITYLRGQEITVADVSQRISRNEESCMHCGTCTAICPTAALSVDIGPRTVQFHKDRCTACGLCTRVCTVGAMHVEMENGGL